MKTVKGDKAMKSVWAAGRRQITPKIGQLTNDAESINRIVCLLHILRHSTLTPWADQPTGSHRPPSPATS